PIVEGLKKLVGGSRSGGTGPEVTARVKRPEKTRPGAKPVARPVSRPVSRRRPPQPTPHAAPEITTVGAAPDRSIRAEPRTRQGAGPGAGPRANQRPRVVEAKIESGLARAGVRPRREKAIDRYDRVVAEMVVRYGVKVRRWRTSMSGVAYEIEYRDGTKKRLIESPRPRSPLSMAIFLHEIG
ncbi:MAG: hypothetical protein JNK70_14590, partial [Phycisphaerae bacterium]|nr:hypothetical protein [Phycisphaerae bacterium]